MGAILGGVFGGLAFVVLIILGYIFVLPRIRGLRLVEKETYHSELFSSVFRQTSGETQLLGSLPTGPITNPAYSPSSDA